MRSRGFVVRPFVTTDEGSWLRCRALAFLQTDYFDDVVPSKPTSDLPPIELVADEDDNDGDVVGLLDLALDGALATIETVATHPDHVGRGIGTALLDEVLSQCPDPEAEADMCHDSGDGEALPSPQQQRHLQRCGRHQHGRHRQHRTDPHDSKFAAAPELGHADVRAHDGDREQEQ